jgi:non-ribosomal peptide synthetase component F
MAYLLQRLLTEAAARHPQRPAVASDGCLLTYQELDRLSNKVARALLRLGVAPGDRVGIFAPKSAAAVLGVYGALKAGACYVPLDPKAPAGRLSHIVRDSGAAVIVADEARWWRAFPAARGAAGSRPLPRPRARPLCRGPRWPGNQGSRWRRNGRSRPTWRTSCTRRDRPAPRRGGLAREQHELVPAGDGRRDKR